MFATWFRKFQTLFQLKEFHSLPRLKRISLGDQNLLHSTLSSNDSSKTKSVTILDKTIEVSPQNGLNKRSAARIRSLKKSQSDILSIIEKRDARVRQLDSDFEKSMAKALRATSAMSQSVCETNDVTMSQSILDKSRLSLKSTKGLKCKVCKRRFHHEFAFQQHQTLHSSHKSKHSSKGSKSLLRRAKSETGDSERHYCQHCSKSFSSKWKLKFHSAIHFHERTVLIVL